MREDTPKTIDPPLRPDAAPPKAAKRFLGGRAFDLLMGLGVLMISGVSLFVAVSANRTQERMLAASVWPSLQFGTSSVSTAGEPQITFDLLNRGVGPARIRWAELSYDGIALRNFREFLQRCCNHAEEMPGFSSGLQHRVLSSDEWINVVRMPREGMRTALWETLDRARHKVRLRACYCSVLDECWMLDSEIDEPTRTKECPAPPAVLWGS